MFGIWLLSFCLYFTKYSWLGLVVLTITASFLVISRKQIYLSFQTLVLAIFIFVFFIYGSFARLDIWREAAVTSLFHLVSLIVLFDLIKPRFNFTQFLMCARILIAICFITYIAGSVLNYQHFFLTSAAGLPRFESIFSEPSYLALVLLLFLAIFLLDKNSVRKYSPEKLALIVGITLSTTITGIVGILFLFGILFVSSGWLKKYALFISFSAAIILFWIFIDKAWMNFFEYRINRIILGEIDRSSYIRLAGSFQVIYHALDQAPIFGLGFGHMPTYIEQNYESFQALYKQDNDGIWYKNTNVDNGFAWLIFNFGLVGLASYIFLLLAKIKNKKIPLWFASTIIFLLFFTGSFVSPLGLGWIGLQYDDHEV